MSVKMIDDKTIAGANSMGRGNYMPLLKKGRNQTDAVVGSWRVACRGKTLCLLLITYDAKMAL